MPERILFSDKWLYENTLLNNLLNYIEISVCQYSILYIKQMLYNGDKSISICLVDVCCFFPSCSVLNTHYMWFIEGQELATEAVEASL